MFIQGPSGCLDYVPKCFYTDLLPRWPTHSLHDLSPLYNISVFEDLKDTGHKTSKYE